jgi:hypothetical protein
MTARNGFISKVQYKIDVPRTIIRLTAKIDAHNIKHAQDSSRQIKAAPRALAEKLVRMYYHRFNDWHLERYGLIEGLDPPLLEMNNQLLAREMTATDRTIRNYKKRLTDLGFILKSIYHGSKKPYELMLNPDFFVFKKRHKDGIWIDNVQIFPPKGSGTNNQYFTSTLLAEKSAKEAALEPGQRKKAPEPDPKALDPAPRQVAPERTPELSSQHEKGSTQTARIQQKSELLFAKIRPLLWPGQYFSQNECNLARENIARIFRKAPDRLERMFQIAFSRCVLASAYWEREFGESLPPPGQFFDPDIERGISATRDWFYDEEAFPTPKINPANKFRLQTYKTTRKNGAISIGSLFNH